MRKYLKDFNRAVLVEFSPLDLVVAPRGDSVVKHVLVADDDADALALISRYLEPLGVQIDVAFSGREALDKVQRNHYDLVISDVRMPNGTGIDLLREMKNLKENMPVILISAAAASAKEQAKAMGADAFLAKPLEREELAHTVEGFVGAPA